jgi:hypothetical protein
MKAALLMLTLSSACVHAERTTLITSTVSIVCDYGQTVWHANRGWRHGMEENPIMGSAPSARFVTTYFVGALLVNGLAPLLLPKWARPVVHGAVTLKQAETVIGNARITPMCGL